MCRHRRFQNWAVSLAVYGLMMAVSPIGQGAEKADLSEDKVYQVEIVLKTPRKKPPRQGGPLDRVQLSMWVPAGTKVIRGALVNPFYLKAVGQKHWQAANRHWGFGIIAANYFGVKSDEFDTTLKAALKKFAEVSGRPEIEHIPLLFGGMSAGAGMAVRFTEKMPGRVIAVAPVCLEVGPRSPDSRHVPMITIFGEKDGKQYEKLAEKLPVERAQGAQWATAVQWGRRHEYARANNLAMSFFDHAIALRYPVGATPIDGPVTLKKIDPIQGWLGDRDGWKTNSPRIAAFADFKGDKTRACWFPNRNVAEVWRAFVSYKPQIKITEPPGMGDGQPFILHREGATIVVRVKTEVGIGVKKLLLYAGDVSVPMTGIKNGVYEAKVQNIRAGIYALFAVAETSDDKLQVSRPHTIIVRK